MNNIPLKVKMWLILYLPIVLFTGTTWYLVAQNVANIDRLTKALYDSTYKITFLALTAERDLHQANANYQRLHNQSLDNTGRTRISADLSNKIDSVDSRSSQLAELLTLNGLEDLTDPRTGETIMDMHDAFVRTFGEWSRLALGGVRGGAGSPDPGADGADVQSALEQVNLNLNAMRVLIEQYAIQEMRRMEENKAEVVWTSVALLAIVAVVLLVIGFLLTERIRKMIQRLLVKVKRVAAGDLQYEPQPQYDKDELGQMIAAVDDMTLHLRGLIGDIAASSRMVADSTGGLSVSAGEASEAAEHVARTIQDVTTRMETQHAIVQEANRAMEEMAGGIQRIAENTTAVAEHTAQASERIDQGSDRVERMSGQLEEILDSVKKLSGAVASLHEKSNFIGRITGDITEFADRTNILSLNASIEAARAGEHGTGFAVVAEEIRKLAAGSMESAASIRKLIATTQTEIADASGLMDTTLAHSEKGGRMMVEMRQDFRDIFLAVQEMVQQVRETASLTEQIAAGSEQVAAGMDQAAAVASEVAGQAQTVAAATEEQAALADNISGASARLQSVAENLDSQIAHFKR